MNAAEGAGFEFLPLDRVRPHGSDLVQFQAREPDRHSAVYSSDCQGWFSATMTI
jgi:hypothetical protein